MIRVELPIDLTLQAPFLTQSTAPGAYGLDAVLARDHRGRIMLPGTLVLGRLRQAWEELRDAVGEPCSTGDPDLDTSRVVPTKEEISDLLGAQLARGDYQPRRKRLHCTDFLFNGVEPDTAIRNRIAIDNERGTAEQGQLMALESPFGSGQPLVFSGLVRFDAGNPEKVAIIREQILCGLQWIAQLGAYRGIGFGRLVDVTAHDPVQHEIKVRENPSEHQPWHKACGLELVCAPEAPFCLADRPRAGNIFTSLEEIAGGVLKGCLAETLQRLKNHTPGTDFPFATLEAAFSQLRFSHAFPSSTCLTRPTRPPLSLVKCKGLYDVALLPGPCLIKGTAPEFSVDWKESDDVRAHFGWPSLRREMRVRTAVDREMLRNQDEELFAYEMIVPNGQCWLARIDASDVEEKDRAEVLRQVAALLRPGLLGLGKSKVAVRVEILEEGTLKSACPQDHTVNLDTLDGFLVLTLQTPALLLDPEALAGKTDRQTLLRAYQTAWNELSGELLYLERFFARQDLSGGRYQHGRFQQDRPYRPWLLTTAGSVFVFNVKVKDPLQVQEKVKEWQRKGLALPPTVIKSYGLPESGDVQTTWQHCPFIPQNGFGEIAVNLEVHQARRPGIGDYESIEGGNEREDCDAS